MDRRSNDRLQSGENRCLTPCEADVHVLHSHSPEPSSLDTDKPEPSSLDTDKPEPSSLDTDKPEPSSLDTDKPEPSSLNVHKPEPSSLDTHKPEPSSLSTDEPLTPCLSRDEFSAVDDTRRGHFCEKDPTQRNTNSIWNGTPYTRKSTQSWHSNTTNADSVYTIEFQNITVNDFWKKRASGMSGVVSPSAIFADYPRQNIVTPRCVPVNEPPIGHHGEFAEVRPRKYKKRWMSGLEDSDTGLRDEGIDILDNNTGFGKTLSALGFSESESLSNKETRKQARNALKLADRLTSVPLSKVWHVFTEVFHSLVFFMSIVVAIVDIVRGPDYLYYKVTALVLGVIENVVTFLMWTIRRHPLLRNSENRERHEKYQQYIENIVTEFLIYPLIILGVLGFTSEEMYVGQNVFGWVEISLLIFDTIALLYNKAVRLHMLRRLVRDLKDVLSKGSDKNQSSWKLAGSILPRTYYMVISNFFVILALVCLFGIQCNRDNLGSDSYRLTVASALIMILLLLLPSLSLVMFFAANLHWVMEIFMNINCIVGSNEEFQQEIRSKYGNTLADTLHYSRSKIPTNKSNLESLQKAKISSKLLYCLHELPFLFMIHIWQWLIVATVYMFDGFEDSSLNVAFKIGFSVIFVLANPHVTLLMVLSNLMVLALILGLIMYPLCLPFCCKKQYKVQSKYSQLATEGPKPV